MIFSSCLAKMRVQTFGARYFGKQLVETCLFTLQQMFSPFAMLKCKQIQRDNPTGSLTVRIFMRTRQGRLGIFNLETSVYFFVVAQSQVKLCAGAKGEGQAQHSAQIRYYEKEMAAMAHGRLHDQGDKNLKKEKISGDLEK